MNTYHVNKWLIFPWWHCGAMRMQSCYFLFHWFEGSFVGIFGGQSETPECLRTSYLKFILQLKVPIPKWIFSCLDAHVDIRQDYSEWKSKPDSHDWSEQSYKKHVLWAMATKLRKGFASSKSLRRHPDYKCLTPKHYLWSSTFRSWYSSWGAWLHDCGIEQAQGKPYKRAALIKSALSKVRNLSPEQMLCWTRDRLPWDNLFWNKAKAVWLKAQIHTSKEQVHPHM